MIDQGAVDIEDMVLAGPFTIEGWCHLALNCKIAVVLDGLGILFEIFTVFSFKLAASGGDPVARTPG